MNEPVCPVCGSKVEQDNAFCPVCGCRLSQNNSGPGTQADETTKFEEPEASRNFYGASGAGQRPAAPPPWSSDGSGASRVPPYSQYPSYSSYPPRRQPGHGWITFLRVFIWVMFAALILLGCYYTVLLIQVRRSFGWVLLMFLGSALVATLVLAAGMVGLNCAENLYDIAENTRKTNELLEELRRK